MELAPDIPEPSLYWLPLDTIQEVQIIIDKLTCIIEDGNSLTPKANIQ
jgi:hypothetical protein